ncbi:MAG: hypothetical protein JWR09_5523 [Mucilaginibacter sp.]|nr:hypothetical protein [Mucilaginibacter sp.]
MLLNSFKYSLNVWLTSVVLSPVLYLIIQNYRETAAHHATDGETVILIYTLVTIVGFFFSIVTWLIFLSVIMLVGRFITNEFAARSTICIAGIVLTVATFMLTLLQSGLFNDNEGFVYLMLANCLCIGCGTWFYNLKPITAEVEILTP